MAAVLLWQSICFLCAMGSARAHASKATSGVQSLVSRHDSQRVIEYCATTTLTTTSMSTTAASPGIMFLNGWMSSMNSTKALFLEDYCQSTGRPFCRFEWFQEGGGGDHPSTSSEPCISTWLEDALQILDDVTDGPQLLVGSSMGAWLGLHICRQRPERIHSLVGIASAPDFSQTFIEPRLSEDQRSQLQTRGYCAWETPYQSTPYRLTQHFLDDARSYNILSDKHHNGKAAPISLSNPRHLPVRLLHGHCDTDISWQASSMELARRLETENLQTIWIIDGDHRLSRPQDLQTLQSTIDECYYYKKNHHDEVRMMMIHYCG